MPPLDDDEVVEWLSLLRDEVLVRDEREAHQALIEPHSIPEASAFADLVDAERTFTQMADMHSAQRKHVAYAAIVSLDPSARAELRDRFRGYAKLAENLAARDEPPWMSYALRDIHGGKPEQWQVRHAEMTKLLGRCRPVIDRLDASARIELNTNQPLALVTQAKELKKHLEDGGKVWRNPYAPTREESFRFAGTGSSERQAPDDDR